MQIPLLPENVCAVIGIIEQESGFLADPRVPGLAKIAFNEIEKRRVAHGIPTWAVNAALNLASTDGRTYRARIQAARTEGDLNNIFDDFIRRVPLGTTLFGNLNPVHTGGPMQVSVSFAEEHLHKRPYPYPMNGDDVRREVFSRRGGLYFGIAHLLDYTANYPKKIYRFADFNAGRYSSRNAAFQNALLLVTGLKLTPDGDILAYRNGQMSNQTSQTAAAARTLTLRIGKSPSSIDADLAQEKEPNFDKTAIYRETFALADRINGKPLPRAVLPQIEIKGPKIRRRLTTASFAQRVETRMRSCLERGMPNDAILPSATVGGERN